MHRKGPLGEPSCGPSRSSASSPAEADPSRFLATSELREAEFRMFRMCALQGGAYFTRTGTSPQALQHSPPQLPGTCRGLQLKQGQHVWFRLFGIQVPRAVGQTSLSMKALTPAPAPQQLS